MINEQYLHNHLDLNVHNKYMFSSVIALMLNRPTRGPTRYVYTVLIIV